MNRKIGNPSRSKISKWNQTDLIPLADYPVRFAPEVFLLSHIVPHIEKANAAVKAGRNCVCTYFEENEKPVRRSPNLLISSDPDLHQERFQVRRCL
jgi:hypothetical protein